MDTLIAGPAASWLASHRDALNARYARAKRKFPALDDALVREALRRALPAVAGSGPGADALMLAVFDLVLLHAGRGTLSARPEIAALLYEAFPALQAVLSLRPEVLPGALSNAAENLGPRGRAFVSRLSQLAHYVDDADALLLLGAIVAWRVGEARLRVTALEAAQRVPPGAFLAALDLDDWGHGLAPRAAEMMREHAWQHPGARGRDAKPIDARAPLACWRTVARVGDFVGFGGEFARPPLLLDAGDETTFYVRCGGDCYRLDADVFGWTCRRHAAMDALVRPVLADKNRSARRAGEPALVVRAGWLERGSERVALESLVRATSFVRRGAVVATTHADSHRIRITVPVAERP